MLTAIDVAGVVIIIDSGSYCGGVGRAFRCIYLSVCLCIHGLKGT